MFIVRILIEQDPKEYLPFLADIQKLDPILQKYTIDKGLKKFESALRHISKAGDEHFEKCVERMRNHITHLYT